MRAFFMRSVVHVVTQVALAGSLLLGLAGAQADPEKHVKDIRAEQPFEASSASALCRKVRARDESIIEFPEVNSATLESDLSALLQKSDEVVAAILRDNVSVLAPSRDRAILYYDARIVRTWKGTHKAGEVLTFSLPRAAISCGSEPGNDRPSMVFFTMTAGRDWGTFGTSPVVLFLRQSVGDEMRFLPGLRLTGGDGMQGIFGVNSKLDRDCFTAPSLAMCNANLDVRQEKVIVPYRKDPLKEKYDAMPVPAFLRELQSTADAQAAAAKVQ